MSYMPLESPYDGLLIMARRIHESVRQLDKYLTTIETDCKQYIGEHREAYARHAAMRDAAGVKPHHRPRELVDELTAAGFPDVAYDLAGALDEHDAIDEELAKETPVIEAEDGKWWRR